MNNVDISKGYIDIPVGGDIDLKSDINRLRKEKNAIILAHYYQQGIIIDLIGEISRFCICLLMSKFM